MAACSGPAPRRPCSGAGRFSISVEGANLELASDLGIAATGIGLAVLVGVLAGLVPGLQSSRREIVPSLRTT